MPTSTYFCLVISFEHVADTPPTGRIVLNQAGEVAGVVAVVDQFVSVLRLTLEDAGTDQRIPLLRFLWLGFTPQSRGRDTKPDLLSTGFPFGGLPAEPAHLCHDPGQHGHGGQGMHRQGAHQLEAEGHPGLVRERVLPRGECDWFHLGKGLETQQHVPTLLDGRPSNLIGLLLVQKPGGETEAFEFNEVAAKATFKE